MKLISDWEWDSSMEALGNIEYSFIAITPRSTVIRSTSTCYGLIYE